MKKVSSIEWLVRLTILLLLFLCSYMLIKLEPIWEPLLRAFLAIFIPFFIAALFTYLLLPIVERIHRLNIPRSVAILIIYVVFFGGLGFALVKGVPYLIEQLRELLKQIPHFARLYQNGIQQFYFHTSDLPETVHDHFRGVLKSLETLANGLIENLISVLKSLAQSFLIILTVPVLVFYFLNDFPKIKSTAAKLCPDRWQPTGKSLLSDIDDTLGSYIRGQLFVCLVLAVLATIGFWLIGIPYPVLFGIIIGITDLIPYFGPFFGAAPVGFVALTLSWQMLLFVLGLIVILHFLEGNFLSPLIVGKSLHLHPIIIILALFVGSEAGGIIGLFLAVPTFAVARVLILHIHRLRLLKD
ncbi:MAG TPA: AI-2E family transporter [Bacillales bacterium]|nr:AI-2E family transporter [Bacillales bacterium]